MQISRRTNMVVGSLLVSALTLLNVASAAPVSYTNLDAGFIRNELDSSTRDDLDGEGLLVRASVSLNESIFVFGHLTDVGYDDGIDGTTWALGVGGHVPVTTALDLVGRVGFLRNDINTGGGRDNEHGYVISGMARGLVMSNLELEGGVQHSHLTNSENNTSVIVDGRYFFTTNVAAGAALQLGDSRSFGIYARISF
jgi:hypothetical protein